MWLLLILAIYPIVFIKLDGFSVRHWDESMYAVNAYEMMQHDEWMVPYYRDEPDIRNTKPPLVLWMQMGLSKIMGFSPLTFRIPSALAVTVSILFLFQFVRKRSGNLAGLVASSIALTSVGFITFHTGRTGDPDAVMALFVLLANFVFLGIMHKDRIKPQHFYLFFGFLALAFWSKSLAALLFIPGYFILALVHKKLGTLLKSAHFWIGSIMFLALCGLFLLLRENAQPGYLDHFFGRDAGRVLVEIEGQEQSFWFYVWSFFHGRFSFWLPFLVLGIVMSLYFFRDKNMWLYRDCTILILGYWLIISFSVTKLSWYDINLFPLMAIVAGYVVMRLLDFSKEARLRPALLIALFAIPYFNIYGESQSNSFSAYEEQKEAKEQYLHKAIASGNNLDGLVVYHHGYRGSLLFYQYWLREQGQEISLLFEPRFERGDQILILNENDDVLEDYSWVELDSAAFVHKIQIR
jgi:4-amino-4-deoxy-L-arabinose transferase-like glycosyltransferase